MDSERQAVEQLCCGHDLAFRASPLALANHVHGLDARDDLGGAMEILESQHRPCSTLDGAVILLDQVVQVL